MSQITWTNYASTILAATLSSSGTSLSVAPGTGSVFPSLGSGQYFKLTLSPSTGTTPAQEIMHVTAISGDVLTVIRAQEGTTAQTWGVGSIVQNLITAQTLKNLLQAVVYPGNPNGNVDGVAASSTVPPTMCWDSVNKIMWICIITGTASTAGWSAQGPLTVNYGDLKFSALGNEVYGWRLCYGQTRPRTDPLWQYLVSNSLTWNWGLGDGSTTYTMPDLRGRSLFGLDNMGGTAAGRITSAVSGLNGTSTGAYGGSQYAQSPILTATSVVTDPGHNHTVTDPGHAHGVYDPGHVHSINNVMRVDNRRSPDYASSDYVGTAIDLNTGSSATGIGIYGSYTGITLNGATTGITVSTSVTSNLTGSNQNIPPGSMSPILMYVGA